MCFMCLRGWDTPGTLSDDYGSILHQNREVNKMSKRKFRTDFPYYDPLLGDRNPTIGNTIGNSNGNSIGNSIKEFRIFPIPLSKIFRFFKDVYEKGLVPY